MILHHIDKRRITDNISRLTKIYINNTQIMINRVPVLCYHRILPEFNNDNYQVNSISPHMFESQMAFLEFKGYHSLSLQEFFEIAKGLRKPQSRSVLVTIDDGYADSSIVGWPISKRHGIKITIFILTNLIGNSTPGLFYEESPNMVEHIKTYPELWTLISWPEIRNLIKEDVSIGIHGNTHQNIAKLAKGALIKDLKSAIKLYEKEIGGLPYAYAIPYGNVRSYTKGDIKILKNEGFELVFSTHTGRSYLPSKKLPLPRIVINKDDDLETFEMKLSGAYDWIHHIRQAQHSIASFLGLFWKIKES